MTDLSHSESSRSGSSPSQPDVWKAVWQATQLTPDGVRKTIDRELRTLRWQALRRALVDHFGTLDGLRTIELGSGTGDVSLLLALEGATPTLLDADAHALQLAREKFAVFDREPDLLVGNFLSLDVSLRGQYDVAISYGTVEHFEGADRERACRAHAEVVRPGGLVAISVPNARCLPYRVHKWWRERRGRWEWGLEIPYTRRELLAIADAMELQAPWIHGSSFLRDWDQFLLNPLTQRIERFTGFHFERRTPFDAHWGHALTLIGVRP